MEAKKLDIIWKLGSIFVLFIGFCMIFYGIKQIDDKMKECFSEPLTYTTKRIMEVTETDHIDCSCLVYKEGGQKSFFNFNENGRSHTKKQEYTLETES